MKWEMRQRMQCHLPKPHSNPSDRSYYYPHFTLEDAEAQRGQVTWPTPHSNDVEEQSLDLNSGRVVLEPPQNTASFHVQMSTRRGLHLYIHSGPFQ